MTNDTKVKILEVARNLFAEKGFNGTSIREIAKEAGVNVAAINYHFQGKENLFIENIKQCHQEMTEEIKRTVTPDCSIEKAALKVFKYFLNESMNLKTNFRYIISSSHPKIDYAELGVEGEWIGPPGGIILYDCLKKEFDHEVSKDDIAWGVQTIFSYIMHKALLIDSPVASSKLMKMYFTKKKLEDGVRKIVSAIIKELSPK